jgi:hypothetical protein
MVQLHSSGSQGKSNVGSPDWWLSLILLAVAQPVHTLPGPAPVLSRVATKVGERMKMSTKETLRYAPL